MTTDAAKGKEKPTKNLQTCQRLGKIFIQLCLRVKLCKRLQKHKTETTENQLDNAV
jgi:hypothetical protein